MRPVSCPLLKTTRSLIHSKQRFSVTTKRGGVEKKDKETEQHAIMLTSGREQIRLFTFSFFLSKHTHCKNMWIKGQERVFFHANASLTIFFKAHKLMHICPALCASLTPALRARKMSHIIGRSAARSPSASSP
jgi:hypothetical protein